MLGVFTYLSPLSFIETSYQIKPYLPMYVTIPLRVETIIPLYDFNYTLHRIGRVHIFDGLLKK